jgi:hypothetical protein
MSFWVVLSSALFGTVIVSRLLELWRSPLSLPSPMRQLVQLGVVLYPLFVPVVHLWALWVGAGSRLFALAALITAVLYLAGLTSATSRGVKKAQAKLKEKIADGETEPAGTSSDTETAGLFAILCFLVSWTHLWYLVATLAN